MVCNKHNAPQQIHVLIRFPERTGNGVKRLRPILFRGEIRPQEHDAEGRQEQPGGNLPEDEEGEGGPDEGRHRVIGAGPGRPQVPLGTNPRSMASSI